MPDTHIVKQLGRGTTAKLNLYTGPVGELLMDTTTNELVLQDGVTQGGIRIGGSVVVPQPATVAPLAPASTAVVGTSTLYAREDHVHPLQTSVATLTTPRTIDGMSFDGSGAIHHFGTCSTAAGTVAKVVARAGFSLVTGARIAVKFTYTNTATNPTLNVNSTGARAIWHQGGNIAPGALMAGCVYDFVYDGSYWQLIGDVNDCGELD